jgi:hypothetical protein
MVAQAPDRRAGRLAGAVGVHGASAVRLPSPQEAAAFIASW